jgi:uncharacterized protein YciI
MERFELVLLRRPASPREVSDEEAEALQVEHLAHLTRMHDEGHLVVAGPFDEQPDEALRGMCLYQTGTLERTRALAESDPSVVAGRLECEVLYFWCQRGFIADPARRQQP